MARTLMILEVSQKQGYIFASRKLRDNLLRSEEIRYVTSADFFADCCPEQFSEKDNMVYAGGGHTVLQFASDQQARRFASLVTERVLRQFPQMELFVKLRPYDETKAPGDNLTALAEDLEAKKARRRAAFHRISFGGGKCEPVDHYEPLLLPEEEAPQGWYLTNDTEKLAGSDNFVAVVHIDGNAMGKRVQNIYRTPGNDWETCVKTLRQFSDRLDAHFAEAFCEMSEDLAKALPKLKIATEEKIFPVRKIIGAGDDVCFITAGALGLDCAASFLQHLSQKRNPADEAPYAACAGVVLVHRKYPFWAAYNMSEALCTNAKAFGAAFDRDGGVSAIDWHIEFGQLKDSLSEIRSDYLTEDGGRLEIRPYAVIGDQVPPERQYAFFCRVLSKIQRENAKQPRSKLKALRQAFKQGEIESRLALRLANMEDFLNVGTEAREEDWNDRVQLEESAFYTDYTGEKAERRCLFFDAIECIDHVSLWRNAE